jgi:bifunctional UDP-N-acetylglucosamine pyrophosphorylase / glucosamine-1-phosphate N-acetyltransferase
VEKGERMLSNHTTQAIVLAAGKSKRFNTQTSKLLEPLCGKPMILYTTQLLEQLAIPATVVIGHQAGTVKEVITAHHQSVTFVEQTEQRGTGDALKQTQHQWHAQNILVINGDMPLITPAIITQLLNHHTTTHAAVTFVTTEHTDSGHAYGRVVRNGSTIKIVEAKDDGSHHADSYSINAGIYLMQRAFLEKHINDLTKDNNAHEYYITDLIAIANQHGYRIETVQAAFDEVRGVNTLKELWIAEHIKRSELISYWMQQGVRFFSPTTNQLDSSVSIDTGTQIHAGVHVLNNTTIGKHCIIEPFCILDNATIGDNCIIKSHSVIKDGTLATNVHIGPFARIHNNSVLQESSVIGNFVEVSRSTVGAATKAKHLSYIGDALIGTHVNIGAGTITCNYDGTDKHCTTIHDNAFIGSNNTIIAPIVIGSHAYTAGGSIVTHDVPDNALAIARARQVIKEGYAQKIEDRKKKNVADECSVAFIGAHKTTKTITPQE